MVVFKEARRVVQSRRISNEEYQSLIDGVLFKRSKVERLAGEICNVYYPKAKRCRNHLQRIRNEPMSDPWVITQKVLEEHL